MDKHWSDELSQLGQKVRVSRPYPSNKIVGTVECAKLGLLKRGNFENLMQREE